MKRLVTGLVLGAGGLAGFARAADPPVQLTTLSDRLAIEQLMTGDYPRALDEHHWKEYAALFTTAAELTFGHQRLKGAVAIERFFTGQEAAQASATPPAAPVHTLHVVTNLSIHLDGDSATAGAYWQTIGQREGHPAVLSAGHYEDLLKKVGGRWKFAKRRILTDSADAPVR